MKKVFIASFIAVSPLLLANCGQSEKEEKIKPSKKEINVEQRTKTESGLEYEIIEPGNNGDSPKSGKKVTVHYTGWLDEHGQKGKKFDSSVDRGTPFNFTIGIGQVIKGWDEGVMSMKVGEKRRLFIPAQLGYGAYGAGNVIPPNANLIFDVELIKID